MIIKAVSNKEFYTDENCFITELINSKEFPEVSIAQARVKPGQHTELHALKGTEIYYILGGTGEVELGGNERATLRQGDLALIKPMESQRIFNPGADDLVFLCICSPRFKPEDYIRIES